MPFGMWWDPWMIMGRVPDRRPRVDLPTSMRVAKRMALNQAPPAPAGIEFQALTEMTLGRIGFSHAFATYYLADSVCHT